MKPRDLRLAVLLEEWAAPRGRFAAGQEITRTLEVGDDLELEVVVRVRRRASYDQVAAYRAAALEQGSRPLTHVGLGCQVYKQGKGRRWGRRGGGRCEGKVVAAVALAELGTGATYFRFVCGRHREHHGADPARILAMVELPPSLLDPLRRQYEAEQRKQEEERIARRRAGLCESCGKVEDDGRCVWHEVPKTSGTREVGR